MSEGERPIGDAVPERVFVTGASGFIGGALVARDPTTGTEKSKYRHFSTSRLARPPGGPGSADRGRRPRAYGVTDQRRGRRRRLGRNPMRPSYHLRTKSSSTLKPCSSFT